ncbi:MAG: HtaA domain-containing protein [Patulibacter sp.]
MSKFRTRALLGAVLTTSAIVAVPATASALSLPAPTKAGGDLNLELTGGAAASLERQNVTISATSPAKRADDLLSAPAATVRFGRNKVLTTNDGSIVFRKGSRSVRFSTLSTHLGSKIRIRASINGETKTVLTADRKKTRVTFVGTTLGELHATKLRLTSAGAGEIRRGLRLDRLGRGTLTKAYGKFTAATSSPAPGTGPAPSVQPAPVSTPGRLVWGQANTYAVPAPPTGGDRTWLGYVTTSDLGAFSTLGTFAPSAGAVGDTVTPASPRGASVVYNTTFPMVSSSAHVATKTGTIQYAGLVTYRSEAHNFTVTVQNPRIAFDGTNTAKLYATGLRTAGGVGGGPSAQEPYDESQPVFNLDLTNAIVQPNADNTTTLRGAAPSVATTAYTFPANYPAGSGPDRSPNTFGSFDITVPNPPVVPLAGQ